ncbi:pseudouridine synthase [Vibrio cholerae CP1046(19)]|nr:pseudouridine synthase [Vibrio cholerae CP1046(19)]
MLEIVYQDEYLVAVNKPAGMLVHRSWLDKHETEFVMQTLRDQIGQHVFPLHRLDPRHPVCWCLRFRVRLPLK